MRVVPIAWTVLDLDILEAETPYRAHDYDDVVAGIDELAEFAGRACYESWNRPDPATQTNEGYLQKIQDHKHFSVLEHGSVTFYIAEVSRSLTHELVRHRHLSFSQLSQRFVDSSDVDFVIPPGSTKDEVEMLDFITREAVCIYEKIVAIRLAGGATRKEARQAARAVLPNATETRIVVTGNIRAWREVIEKRNDPGADVEIRELARQILLSLSYLAPNSVQDLELNDE